MKRSSRAAAATKTMSVFLPTVGFNVLLEEDTQTLEEPLIAFQFLCNEYNVVVGSSDTNVVCGPFPVHSIKVINTFFTADPNERPATRRPLLVRRGILCRI